MGELSSTRPQRAVIFSLSGIDPPPFRDPGCELEFALPVRSHVTLTVYNTLGQQVAMLVQGEQEAGYHEIVFDASGCSSGIYFYRIAAGEFTDTRTFVLVRYRIEMGDSAERPPVPSLLDVAFCEAVWYTAATLRL